MSLANKAANIKLLICDVDGVLTDGRLFYTAEGEAIKAFHVHDGLGIKLLKQVAIEVAIITSRQSEIVSKRMQQLNIKYIYQNQHIKMQALTDIIKKLNLTLSEVAYVGDDLPDLACMRQVGLSIAVKNARDVIKQHADWVTQNNGGTGAVREIAELLLTAQNKWALVLEQYLA